MNSKEKRQRHQNDLIYLDLAPNHDCKTHSGTGTYDKTMKKSKPTQPLKYKRC